MIGQMIQGVFEKLPLLEGIEQDLLKRKNKSRLGLLIGVVGAVWQAVMLLTKQGSGTPKFFSGLPGTLLDPAYAWETAGFAVAVSGFSAYLLLSKSRLLLQEARAPFRYTFWVVPFAHVKSEGDKTHLMGEDDPVHYLLHHDLREKLSERIRRLALLDTAELAKQPLARYSSHIQIRGAYTEREENGKRILHIMPQVSLGADEGAEKLTYPVRFVLPAQGLSGKAYQQVLEHVYSRVATEIYRQIKQDLTQKVGLFPTNYLRAVAYYNEAEDFAQSNTVDAYDYAVELYRESLRYFQISFKTAFNWLQIHLPIVRWGIRYNHIYSKTHIGYARCLIYRRQVSALSGRSKNPLFEIPDQLEEVVDRMTLLYNKMVGGSWQIERPSLNGAPLPAFSPSDILDPQKLCAWLSGQFSDPQDFASEPPFSEQERLWAGRALREMHPGTAIRSEDVHLALNKIVNGIPLDEYTHFRDYPLPEAVRPWQMRREMARKNRARAEVRQCNRYINYLLLSEWARGWVKEPPQSLEMDEQESRLRTTMATFTFRKDRLTEWFKVSEAVFEQHQRILFDSFTVLALAYHYLESPERAVKLLQRAKAIAPVLSENDPLHLVSAAEMEPLPEKKLPFLVKATELAPSFEIARYLLAHCHEVLFRQRDELSLERARVVIDKYSEVLALNPGNIASLVAKGHIFWLSQQLDAAVACFEQGLEIKAIVQQTYASELHFGLARVFAEQGLYTQSYDHYQEALLVDPGVAANTLEVAAVRGANPHYLHIGTRTLQRYHTFWERVSRPIQAALSGLGDQYHLLLLPNDVRSVGQMAQQLRNTEQEAHRGLYALLSRSLQQLLEKWPQVAFMEKRLQKRLAMDLNRLILSRSTRIGAWFAQYLGQEAHLPAKRREWLDTLFGSSALRPVQSPGANPPDTCSQSTYERVLAMVYNELANALFFHYLYHGARQATALDEALEAYRTARQLAPDNRVILFNLANALNFNTDENDAEEQFELLQKAVETGALWHVATVSLVRFGLQRFEKKRKDLLNRKAFLEEKRRALSMREQSATAAMREFDWQPANRLVEYSTPSLSETIREQQKDFFAATEAPRGFSGNLISGQADELRMQRENPEQERQTLDASLYELRDQLNEIPEQQSDFFRHEIGRFVRKTRISSLFGEGALLADGKRLADLLEAIEKDRLDESDIEAVLVWAEVLANRDDTPEAAHHAERICWLLLERYPILGADTLMLLRQLRLRGLAAWMKQLPKDKTALLTEMPMFRQGVAALRHYDLAIDRLTSHSPTRLPQYFLTRQRYQHHSYLDISLLLADLQRYDTAETFYREIIRDAPNLQLKAQAYMGIGHLEMRKGNYLSAADAYQEARSFDPHAGEIQFYVALAWFQAGRHQHAVSFFEKATSKELTASFLFAYLAQAHKAVANNELAEWLFREAVALSPDRDYYWYELGNLLLDNRQYYQAALCFQRLVRRDDEKPVYFFKLGMAHKWLGRWAQAAINFEEALDQDPQNPEYILQLAEALFHQHKFADMLDLLETHPASQSHLNAYLALQIAATQTEEGEKKAWALLEKNLSKPVFAQDPERMAELGKKLAQDQDHPKAIFCLEKALQAAPERADWLAECSLSHLQLKQLDLSLKTIQQAVKLEPENTVWLDYLGIVQINLNEYHEALACYQKAVRLQPEKVVYAVKLAGVYDLLLESERASHLIAHLKQRDSKNAEVLNETGNAFYRYKYFAHAKDCYQRAIQLAPTESVYYSNLGLALRELNEWPAAREAFQKAVHLRPFNSVNHNDLGNLLYLLKEEASAIPAYRQALRLEPTQPQYHANLGLMYLRLYQKDTQAPQAKKWLEQSKLHYLEAWAMNPLDSKLALHLAVVYNDLDNHREALRYAQTAAKLLPQSAEYQEEIGLAYERMKDWEKAAPAYEQAAKLQPDVARMWNKAGVAWFHSGHHEKALACYQKAIALDGHQPTYFDNLGLVYERMEQWEKAIAAYQERAALLPAEQTGEAMALIAQLYAKQGLNERAIHHFKEALKTDQNNVSYLRSLANLSSIHADETYQTYKRLQQLNAMNENDWYRLSELHAHRGDWPQALQTIKEALRLSPNQPEWEAKAGDICQSLEDPTQAIEHYQRAYLLAPQHIGHLTKLIHAYLLASQMDKAKQYLKKGQQLAPNAPEWDFPEGKIAQWENDYPTALAAFQKSIEHAPHAPEAQAAYLETLLQLGQDEAAENHFLDLINGQPSADFMLDLGMALAPFAFEKAHHCFEVALVRSDEPTWVAQQAGDSCFAQFEYAKAARFYRYIIDQQEDFPYIQALYLLCIEYAQGIEAADQYQLHLLAKFANSGHLLHQLGEELFKRHADKRAMLAFQQAIAANPLEPDYYFSLYQLYLLNLQTSTAQDLLDQALNEHKQDAQFCNVLGVKLFHQSYFAAAKPFMLRASQMEPANPNFLDNLGLVNFNLGAMQEAAEAFFRLVRIKPEELYAQSLAETIGLMPPTEADFWKEKCRKELPERLNEWIKNPNPPPVP